MPRGIVKKNLEETVLPALDKHRELLKINSWKKFSNMATHHLSTKKITGGGYYEDAINKGIDNKRISGQEVINVTYAIKRQKNKHQKRTQEDIIKDVELIESFKRKVELNLHIQASKDHPKNYKSCNFKSVAVRELLQSDPPTARDLAVAIIENSNTRDTVIKNLKNIPGVSQIFEGYTEETDKKDRLIRLVEYILEHDNEGQDNRFMEQFNAVNLPQGLYSSDKGQAMKQIWSDRSIDPQMSKLANSLEENIASFATLERTQQPQAFREIHSGQVTRVKADAAAAVHKVDRAIDNVLVAIGKWFKRNFIQAIFGVKAFFDPSLKEEREGYLSSKYGGDSETRGAARNELYDGMKQNHFMMKSLGVKDSSKMLATKERDKEAILTDLRKAYRDKTAVNAVESVKDSIANKKVDYSYIIVEVMHKTSLKEMCDFLAGKRVSKGKGLSSQVLQGAINAGSVFGSDAEASNIQKLKDSKAIIALIGMYVHSKNEIPKDIDSLASFYTTDVRPALDQHRHSLHMPTRTGTLEKFEDALLLEMDNLGVEFLQDDQTSSIQI